MVCCYSTIGVLKYCVKGAQQPSREEVEAGARELHCRLQVAIVRTCPADAALDAARTAAQHFTAASFAPAC